MAKAWVPEQAFNIGPDEGCFVRRFQLLDKALHSGVRDAVEALNGGATKCSSDFCMVFSASEGMYYLLYKTGKEEAAMEALAAAISDVPDVDVVPERDSNLLIQDIMKDERGSIEATLQVKWRDSKLDLMLPAKEARAVMRRLLPAQHQVPAQPDSREDTQEQASSQTQERRDNRGAETSGASQVSADALVQPSSDQGLEKAVKEVAPSQKSTVASKKAAPEQIPVAPTQRTSPAVNKSSKMALVAGAGAPIDPELHPIQDVERSAKIDPNRTVPQTVQSEVVYEKGVPVANAVIYETASVSAKLRNVLQVGGERPSSVHLFSEQVETPTVRLQSAPRRDGTVGGRPGENISDLTPMSLLQTVAGAAPLMVKWKGDDKASFLLYIENGLLDVVAPTLRVDGSVVGAHIQGRAINPVVAAHACIFSNLLTECKEILALERSIQMIYMPTICADMAVAMADDMDRIVVNLMAFQQSECCHYPSSAEWMVLAADNCWTLYSLEDSAKLEAAHQSGCSECQLQIGRWTYSVDLVRNIQRNDQTKTERRVCREETLPLEVRPEEYRRQLQYWTQRIAMVLNSPGPTGLYDALVRERFKSLLSKARVEGRATEA